MQEQAPFALTTDQKQQRLPFAVASLILGFLSCTMLGILSGIPAVICGHISLSKFRSDPKRYITGKRLAVSGLFLGYTGNPYNKVELFSDAHRNKDRSHYKAVKDLFFFNRLFSFLGRPGGIRSSNQQSLTLFSLALPGVLVAV